MRHYPVASASSYVSANWQPTTALTLTAPLQKLWNAKARQRISIEGVGLPGQCVPFFGSADNFDGNDHLVSHQETRLGISGVNQSAIRSDAEFSLAYLHSVAINLDRVFARILIAVSGVG